jgi:hypothetical protein
VIVYSSPDSFASELPSVSHRQECYSLKGRRNTGRKKRRKRAEAKEQLTIGERNPETESIMKRENVKFWKQTEGTQAEKQRRKRAEAMEQWTREGKRNQEAESIMKRENVKFWNQTEGTQTEKQRRKRAEAKKQ